MTEVGDVPVSLVISEPWELASDRAGSPRHACVTLSSADEGEAERALVQVVEPIAWKGGTFRYLVVKRRDGAGIIADLERGASIECSFVGQPDERANGADPLDTTWWRGGLAGRATLRPVAGHP